MKRILCVIVSLVMIITVLTACKKETKQTETTSPVSTTKGNATQTTTAPPVTTADELEGFKLSKEKITLRVLTDRNPSGGELKDLSIFKALEEITNIHLEFDTPLAGEEYTNKKNLALATGDLPDIFFSTSGSLALKDEEVYGAQGYLIPLNDLINEHAPYWEKRMEEDPVLANGMKSSDGNIYALVNYFSTATIGTYKPVINKEWLDNLGLKLPETIDALYDVLVKFRDEDANKDGNNNEIPLTSQGMNGLHGMLLSAFGELGPSWGRKVYVKDGIVQFYPVNDGYKYFLQYLNKLYQEKLLDNNFYIYSSAEFNALTKENLFGVAAARGQADYAKLEALGPFTSQYNSEKWASNMSKQYMTGRFAITKDNKYPVESIKLADLFARNPDEAAEGICGASLWLGRKGIDWDITPDGMIEYLFTPPEGENESTYLLKNIAPSTTTGFGICILPYPFKGGVLEWVGIGNVEKLLPYVREDMIYPSVIRFSLEDSDRLNILQTDLNTKVNEMAIKFVIGEESFDNWDQYLDALKRLGSEEYAWKLQRAYDIFMGKE